MTTATSQLDESHSRRGRVLFLGASAILFALILANCVWWAQAIPPAGAPDEPDHEELVRYVRQNGRLPRYGEESFLVALWDSGRRRVMDARTPRRPRTRAAELRIPYVFVPQLPYFLNGWISRLAGFDSLVALRGVNGLWIAGAALMTMLAARALWPRRLLGPLIAGACVGLWPQMTFLGAYLNDDAFAVFAAATLIAACSWNHARPLDRKRALVLGASVGLVLSTKPYVLALLPPMFVWLLVWIRRRRREQAAGELWRRLALTAVVAMGVAAPWGVRNALLYDGDPTGQRFMRREVRKLVESLPRGVLPPAKWLFLKPAAYRPDIDNLKGPWLEHSLSSFWARFGWMNVRPPKGFVSSALIVVSAGLLLSLLTARSALLSVPGIFALPTFALLVAASIWNTLAMDYQPQGRYLLASVPPILLLVTGALGGIRYAILSRLALVLFMGFFAAQNVYCRLEVLR